MNRPVRTTRAAIALIAVTAIGVLTGCTAQPTPTPASGTTAKAAAVQEFVCPELTEVAALTATPFSSRTAGTGACSYSTAVGAVSSTVTVQRLAASDDRTAAAIRYSALRRGATTTDLRAVALDAFTASTAASCSAWFPATDGVVTSVTARQDGVTGSKECGVAGAVATLVGSGSASAPTVAVLAQRSLLGTTTSAATWPWLVGRDAGDRIDRVTGTGLLSPSSSTALTAAAKAIPADSAAVVLVTGEAELGASRLEVLSAATAALSAAAGRAPHAKLIVVGPVAGSSASATELAELRVDLQSAATIGGATYIDPATDLASTSSASAALAAVAGSITAELQDDGVARS